MASPRGANRHMKAASVLDYRELARRRLPKFLFELGAAGETGVAHVLKLIEAEMRVAMALTGVTHLTAIDRCVLIDETTGACEHRSPEARA